MNESIIKTDRRGRLRYTPEQKKTMVDAYLATEPYAPTNGIGHANPFEN